MSTESGKGQHSWVGQLLKSLAALLAVIFAGPVLTITVTALLISLLFAGCMATIIIGVPIMALTNQEQVSEARATATFEARIATHPLPAGIEPFFEADAWKFSPRGDFALLRRADQALMMQVRTRAIQPVDLRYDARLASAVWLDDRRLFMAQSQATLTGYGFVLFIVTDEPAFAVQERWLPAFRADKMTVDDLLDKELFLNTSPYVSEVVVLSQTGGMVIDASDANEKQTFETLLAGLPVTQMPFHDLSSGWRQQEAYSAPDGSHYATVWPSGTHLAILQPGGDIVAVVESADFGPGPATCHVNPIHWLPDSRGVLFDAGCSGINRGILVLPVPQ